MSWNCTPLVGLLRAMVANLCKTVPVAREEACWKKNSKIHFKDPSSLVAHQVKKLLLQELEVGLKKKKIIKAIVPLLVHLYNILVVKRRIYSPKTFFKFESRATHTLGNT